jgi:hypothetical protein
MFFRIYVIVLYILIICIADYPNQIYIYGEEFTQSNKKLNFFWITSVIMYCVSQGWQTFLLPGARFTSEVPYQQEVLAILIAYYLVDLMRFLVLCVIRYLLEF